MTSRIWAIALSTTLLTGCQAALWSPFGPSSQPTMVDTQAPGAVVPLTPVQAVVRDGAKVLAGYTVEVRDASTGQVFPTVASAPSNGVPALVVPGGKLTTDAEGNAKLMLAGVTKGQMLMVTATGEGKTLQALFQVGRTVKPAAYTVAQAEEAPRLEINFSSTVGAKLFESLARTARVLEQGARGELLGDAFDRFQKIQAALNIQVTQNPDLSAKIVITPVDGGSVIDAANALSQLLREAGLKDDLTSFIADEVQNFATRSREPGARAEVPNERISFPGTNLLADIQNLGEKVTLINFTTGVEVDAGNQNTDPVLADRNDVNGVDSEEPPTQAVVTIR